MKTKSTLFGVILLTCATVFAQEVKTAEFGKGLFNIIGKDSTFTMNFAFRFQLLGVSTWQENGPNDLNFLVRRSRLKLKGFIYSPKLRYKFEAGLSNRDMSGGSSEFTSGSPRFIMDARVEWNFFQNFELWVGQGKLPGNRERVISSGNLQLVDRSILNRRFNIDRDIGFQLRHHINLTDKFILREIFSLSQGEGRNVTSGNLGGHQYVGRLELLPFGNFQSKGDYKGSDLKREQTPKLSVAASYEYHNNAVKTRSNQGSYMRIDGDTGFYETNINTVFIDGMFKYKGYSLMFEYADRIADDPIAKNSDGTETGQIVQIGQGLNIQSGYLFPSNWEVTGRYSNIKMDEITKVNSSAMYTLGFSKFLVGHKLKVQSDISYTDIQGKANEFMARLQMDIHF
ncbi:porin [Tamlana fucoidanivorans]|uniref:Porin n=1 Tax=Allotamlana fucoidanivorans TaxID=2583814 RepID=A0A5C4SNJ2_9FLAO|nr:porin [Tamlana fucoidanivorans]TNJ45311.1 porin [Tamlana fucoidanivorans]